MDPASSEEHGDRRLMNLFPIKNRLESSISLSLKNEKNVEDLVKVRRSEKETSNLRELISKNLFFVLFAYQVTLALSDSDDGIKKREKKEKNTEVKEKP